jgi:MoaA/NifB/PqqE/SkfB family radical SAM enzyme
MTPASSYSAILQRTSTEHVLYSVLLELTYRCNLNCYFCYNDTSLQGKLMRLSDYQALLSGLTGLGTMQLTLSGGEPLAHPDFFGIGACAREQGFVVRIKSTGHALTERKIRRIQSRIDPFIVELSLHGACAATHDRQTRVAGSFEQLISNVRTMRERGLRIKFNSTLTAWNEHEFEQMFALADELGVRLQFDTHVTPRDDGDRSVLSISPSAAAVSRLMQAQRRRAAASKPAPESRVAKPRQQGGRADKHCGAGASSLTIDPYGNVYPCVQWRRAVGNLHQRSVGDIWRDSVELAHIRQENREVKQMLDAMGGAHSVGGFCPGIAVQLQGSSRALYRQAEQSANVPLRLIEQSG